EISIAYAAIVLSSSFDSSPNTGIRCSLATSIPVSSLVVSRNRHQYALRAGPCVSTCTTVGDQPWLTLPIARDRAAKRSVGRPAAGALERAAPAAEQRFALIRRQRRLEAAPNAPARAHVVEGPQPDADPRQIGGAERGRLG